MTTLFIYLMIPQTHIFIIPNYKNVLVYIRSNTYKENFN